jgi:hypothetical protein
MLISWNVGRALCQQTLFSLSILDEHHTKQTFAEFLIHVLSELKSKPPKKLSSNSSYKC